MGGININQKHNLINNSKSPLFYTLISVIILTILTIIAISIKLSFSNAADEAEGANDTGVATLNNVDILQAGTGQSVTIKGETLDEITLNQEAGYGTDDASRRIILNNNVVRYDATYNVTSPGIIELSITLPANNTIDEATIGSAQQCMDGSKLESADITNSDGTVTKSYTNNKATCIRNITSPGSTNWNITAYPWGSNNEQITPTLAINGQAQATKPEPITVVGRGNYSIGFAVSGVSQGVSEKYNLSVGLGYGLYIDYAEQNNLGVSPVDEWSFDVDMSEWPSGWEIDAVFPTYGLNYSSWGGNGVVTASKLSNDVLNITGKGTIAGTYFCMTSSAGASQLGDDACVQSMGSVRLAIPNEELTNEYVDYEISNITPTVIVSSELVQHSVDISGIPVRFSLSSRGKGALTTYSEYALPGWSDTWSNDYPVYNGQAPMLRLLTVNNYGAVSYIENIDACMAVTDSRLIDIAIVNDNMSDGGYSIEWGVLPVSDGDPPGLLGGCGSVGDNMSDKTFFNNYGQAVDYANSIGEKVNVIRIHLDKLRNGRDVLIGHLTQLFAFGDNYGTKVVTSTFAISSNQYDLARSHKTYTLTPGLLSHTLTAEPSSTNPGKEDHITITTKTYNKDTNSKITINLPNGLIPKEGSFTITTGYEYNDETNTNEPIKAVLVEGEGQDYTITSGDGSVPSGSSSSTPSGSSSSSTSSNSSDTIVTFDLDHIAATHHVSITGYDPIYPGESGVTNIALNSNTGLYEEVVTTNNNNTDSNILNDDLPIAADNDGNGISHIGTPIEFDVTINEDTPSPSTLTINSTASGTGTDYASTTFRTASDTIAVAEPPAMFGYDLVASSDNIYAGDNLTYNYSISNTTSSNANDITMLTVLPFNGDSRGTTGLKNLESLPSDGASGLDTSATKLYYTLDPKAHELESNPEALAADSSIAWQELELDSSGNIPDDAMTNLQDQGILDSITALKLTTTTLPSSSSLKLNLTLDNILATTPGSEATLANDITYLSYASEANQAVEQVVEQAVEGTTNTNTKTILRREGSTTTYSNGQIVSVHQNPVKVNYLGELLALSIPEGEQTIQVDLDLNDVVIGNPDTNDDSTNPVNHLSLTTATLRGYTLTAQTSTEDGALLTEQEDARSIPAISTEPTKGTAGWSAKIAGSNNQSLTNTTWTAIPGTNQTPLNLYTSTAKGRDNINLTVTYGFSAAGTIADTYSTKVVYTVVAEP